MTQPLFTPLQAGDLALSNRILMAPLTRGRAEPDGTPTEMMVEYYAARAEAGLIITEATAISQQGYGWVQAPGVFTDRQMQGWRPVVDAVHRTGGRIVLQLWHMGRVSHPDFQNGGPVFGPSPIAAKGEAHTPKGKTPYVVPHAMTVEEINATVKDYATAARRAMNAGFDGVEVHGANGYLLDEFLRSGSNHRTDAYGGTPENRARFLHEAVEAVVREIGPGKVGVRLSPKNEAQDMQDDDPVTTFGHAAEMLDQFGLAYLHVLEAVRDGTRAKVVEGSKVTPTIRQAFNGVLVANAGYDFALGNETIASNQADAIAFGVPFIANPDLVERFRRNAPLNVPDVATFYTHGPEGYVDYPRLGQSAA